MMYQYGKKLRVNLFGKSHGESVGCIIEGLPIGMKIDYDAMKRKIDRRKPSEIGTGRKEDDEISFEHGVENGIITDSCVMLTVANKNVNRSAYEKFKTTPRPGHADLPALMRGYDISGGGQFSGRMTAPLVAAGALAEQITSGRGIGIAAYSRSIGNVDDIGRRFDEISNIGFITGGATAEIDAEMYREIEKAKNDGDSIGGVVECIVIGLPIGFGGCRFESLDAKISHAIMSIPGVKGIEFGDGFPISKMKGSESNDQYSIDNGKITTLSNHMGGIVGGMSNGSDLIFRAAVKPTPSISKKQRTVDLKKKKETTVIASGRHDPCIVPRIIPVIESMTAIVIADEYLSDEETYSALQKNLQR